MLRIALLVAFACSGCAARDGAESAIAFALIFATLARLFVTDDHTDR